MKLLDEKACIDLVDAGSDEPYDENEPKSYTFIARSLSDFSFLMRAIW